LLLGMYSKRSFPVIASFLDPFSIVPMVIISFIVLKEVLVFENGTVPEPYHLRVKIKMVILTCFAVPTNMLYTPQEIRRIK
ncbi:peptide ABC transporter permease, partial [Bacillus cereus]|nr:peptide ABC transporter permease [Bacillus cereus]